MDFQKKPENQKKWKVFIRKDLDDVTWTNIPRYMTYLPRFVMIWGAVCCAGFAAFIA
jgi:hypothetical protein